ncbi:MAG: hypothetical protein R3B48_18440 [Kofleriaceae bacterium]
MGAGLARCALHFQHATVDAGRRRQGHAMEDLLNLIRAAAADGSTPQARQEAAAACRTLLQTLEAAPDGAPDSDGAPALFGSTVSEPTAEPPEVAAADASKHAEPPAGAMPEPSAQPEPAPPTAPVAEPMPKGPSTHAIDPKAVAAIVASLRSVPPEQLLDLAIERLRAALPPDGGRAPRPLAPPVRFQLVPVPSQWAPSSTGKKT